MTVTRITADDPRLVGYRNLTDVPLRSALEVTTQRFILEGLLVLERALDAGVVPLHVLTSERMAGRVESLISDRDIEILVAADDVLQSTTGYHVHRGVLAEAHRPPSRQVQDLVAGAQIVLMLEALRDHANVGAAFRNAAALGVDAVLVSPDCADPLYRRAVKTSMGAVLQVPWTRVDDWLGTIAELRAANFEVLALTPDTAARSLASVAAVQRPRALLVGTEGAGLQAATMQAADALVRIPMTPGPDSLNAAAATAIALYAIGPSSAG